MVSPSGILSAFSLSKNKKPTAESMAPMPPAPDPVSVRGDDMLAVIKDLPFQIKEALTLGTEVIVRDPIDHIIIAGVGGSAIAGSVLQTICYMDKTPLTVCRAMALPGFANERTLVIAISYSGDTDETISMYTDATKKKCKIVVIASGGKLARLARQDANQVVMVPRGLMPRSAIGYLTIPVLAILSRSQLVTDHLDGFETMVALLERSPYTASAQNLARRLAGSTPLIYTTPRLEGIGQRWKIAFNENAKVHAFCNTVPEIGHNEILAFGSSKVPYHAILLRDDRDSLQLKRRMDAIKTLIRNHGTQVTDIELKGASMLAKIMTAVHLGDYVSYHLAEDLGVDSVPIKLIDEYKTMVRKAEGQK